ncbi:tetratricopeptide repeat protein [Nodularia sphaerocarpa]|uniref:tetratricopeptide repeat protein n=1 Tax=Nodularia sphaerocarpa TaxID=137816 RepID=UPI001EFAFEF6|nr:tetratricopeptide repeat protein [Nodularia sphaerocarpa]MDB9372293.1 tetratricopeptide repeat protein [Nodularia sphaerocarpa CS-585]MDB9376335.1 tetratricopeptide repeat protein [Nodularia sphaerocarpa CS-585A2]ULP74539.1 Beta-barrel assembly-enhancing protease [Nodularia sphaerocarpa UHCC 0038]
MLENFQTTDIFAIIPVAIALTILGYFSWKTLVSLNSFQKGVKLYEEKDYQGAEAAFRQVISNNSTNDVVRLLLGDILKEKGNVKEATELYQEVIRSSPKNPDAYLRIANIFMEENQPEKAKENLEQAKALLQKQRQPQRAEKVSHLLDKITAKIGNQA